MLPATATGESQPPTAVAPSNTNKVMNEAAEAEVDMEVAVDGDATSIAVVGLVLLIGTAMAVRSVSRKKAGGGWRALGGNEGLAGGLELRARALPIELLLE